MKKIYIGPPTSNTKQSLLAFIFSEIVVLGASAFFLSFVPIAVKVISKIELLAVGTFLFGLSIFTIFKRIKNEKKKILVDDSGFTFKNSKKHINWEEIENISFTFMFQKEKNIGSEYTGYPILLLKLKNSYVHSNETVKVFKSEVPYIVGEEYFKEYLGKGKGFTIAINAEDMSEKNSEILITNLPIKVERVRPLMEVENKKEYNKKIYELVSPELQKEYLLD